VVDWTNRGEGETEKLAGHILTVWLSEQPLWRTCDMIHAIIVELYCQLTAHGKTYDTIQIEATIFD
jgi:hypothetical protein